MLLYWLSCGDLVSWWWWWWWWVNKVVFAHSYSKNSHECANKNMLWQTVQFLVHARKWTADDSCKEMLALSSTWTVLRRQSCNDRSRLCMSLERQGHHVQLSVSADGWGSRRPVDTWWTDSSSPVCAVCVKHHLHAARCMTMTMCAVKTFWGSIIWACNFFDCK